MTKQETMQALINADLKANPHPDLKDVTNEDFVENYEFLEGWKDKEYVKHKQGRDVYEVLYKNDGSIRLFRFSNVEAMSKLEGLRGAMTKIILESGFKPDKK